MTISILSLVAAAALVGLAIGVVMIFGAVRMMQLRSYRWATATSILALLPCGPSSILGIAIGIWALIVLSRPNVKAAFDDQAADRPLQT